MNLIRSNKRGKQKGWAQVVCKDGMENNHLWHMHENTV
jgi:hypothetical protein